MLVLAVVLPIGLASLVVSDTSAAAPFLRVVLFALFLGSGIYFAVIDVREGRCLNRPSVTREDAPVMFWGEVAASLFGAFVGASKLWEML